MKTEKILKAIEKLSEEEKQAIFSKLDLGDDKEEEVPANESVENKQDNPSKEVEKEPIVETDKKEETVETKEQTQETPAENANNGQVTEENVEDQLMYSVDDIVTKDFLEEKLSAFDGKYRALLDENKQLKDKIGQMENKYENHNFGNETQKSDFTENSNHSSDYVSFAEYSQDYINK